MQNDLNNTLPTNDSDYIAPAELARLGSLAKSWRYARSSRKHAVIYGVTLISVVFILLILISGILALSLRSADGYTAANQLVVRLSSFSEAGAFFVLTAVLFSFVALIYKVFSRLNILQKACFAVIQAGSMVLVIVFAVFAVRASGAIFSSPIVYTGTCSLSTFKGSSTRVSNQRLDYFLKIPNRFNSFLVSHKTYSSLGGATGSATIDGHSKVTEYACNRNVTMKYIDGTDTIIDLQPLAVK